MGKKIRYVAPALLVLGLLGAPALGDTDVREDPQEYEGMFDVAEVRHGHGTLKEDGTRPLKHKITMHEAWADTELRHGSITIRFRKLDRRIEFAYKNGLKAIFYNGKKKVGNATVRRPSDTAVAVTFPAEWLGEGVEAYRWRVATTWRPECEVETEEEPCPAFSDNAPDAGTIHSKV